GLKYKERRTTTDCGGGNPKARPKRAPGVSRRGVWSLTGPTRGGPPWTPAVPLLQGRNGLSAPRMAVLCMFREPSLCRHVRRELPRNAWLDFTPKVPTTACHQSNYVETYSRSIEMTTY